MQRRTYFSSAPAFPFLISYSCFLPTFNSFLCILGIGCNASFGTPGCSPLWLVEWGWGPLEVERNRWWYEQRHVSVWEMESRTVGATVGKELTGPGLANPERGRGLTGVGVASGFTFPRVNPMEFGVSGGWPNGGFAWRKLNPPFFPTKDGKPLSLTITIFGACFFKFKITPF